MLIRMCNDLQWTMYFNENIYQLNHVGYLFTDILDKLLYTEYANYMYTIPHTTNMDLVLTYTLQCEVT